MPTDDYTSTSSTVRFTARVDMSPHMGAPREPQREQRSLPRNFFTSNMCDSCRHHNTAAIQALTANHPDEIVLCKYCLEKLTHMISRGMLSALPTRLVHIQDIILGTDNEEEAEVEHLVPRYLLTYQRADEPDSPLTPEDVNHTLDTLGSHLMRKSNLKDVAVVSFSAHIAPPNWGMVLTLWKSAGGNMQANAFLSCNGLQVCSHCANTFVEWNRDTYFTDTARYCSTRCQGYYAQCYSCGNVGRRTSMRNTHRGYVCNPCFENSQINCDVCGAGISIYNTRDFDDVGRVCYNCQENRSVECFSCGRSGYTFTYYERNIDGHTRYFCDRCAGQVVARIYPYNYRPRNYVYYGKLPYYGLEVEVDNFPRPANRCSLPLIEKFSNEERLFYIKRDGSLRNGFELVFHPRGVEAWVELDITFQQILDDVVDLGGFAQSADTCGIHVHRSKQDLKAIDETKMVMLLKSLQPFIIKVSKRDNERYASWNTFGGSLQPPTGSGKADRYKRQAYHVVKRGTHKVNRYQCVNFGSNRDTIEFRTYKGSLCPHTIYSYLSFSHYIVEFAKTMLIGELNATPPMQLWQNFLSFLQRRQKQPFVGTLLDYLHDRGIGVAMHTPTITKWRVT